ncbi:CASP-like protein 1F3 [Coffea eugenioides]|uniref:CASP-like protein 1F3 n=1 Tax=Coffea eugenioides TaxID=49369 RepID=UPI000F606B67|nr:CASP-like protein 1F3 [Coffea eugenioides]
MELQMTRENADYTVGAASSPQPKMGGGEGAVDDHEGQSLSSSRRRWRTKALVITQLTLRALVVAFSLAAIIITITAKQTVNVGILTFTARYNYSSAMRFQLGANSVVCALSFLSMLLFVLPLRSAHPQSEPPGNYFYLLLHDMVLTMLVISGCAAGSTVGYLAKYGQEQGSWIAFCTYLHRFCNQLQAALAFAYLAFFCMFVLTIVAASKLKSHVR